MQMSTTYVLVKYLYDIFKILLKNTQKFLWTTTKNTNTSKMCVCACTKPVPAYKIP